MRTSTFHPTRQLIAVIASSAILLAAHAHAGVKVSGQGVRLGSIRTIPVTRAPSIPSTGHDFGHQRHHTGSFFSGFGFPYGYSYDYGYRRPYRDRYYRDRALFELVRRYDPQLVYGPDQPTPEPPDEGLVALKTRHYAQAVQIYTTRHTQQLTKESAQTSSDDTTAATPTPDRTAQRLVALALVGDRKFDEAVKQFREAYDADPSLGVQPLNGKSLLRSTRELRKFVNTSVRHAHRVRTPDAWFMVAALMQAEGRDNDARRMLDRAEHLRNPSQSRAASDTDKAQRQPAARRTQPDTGTIRLARIYVGGILDDPPAATPAPTPQPSADAPTPGDAATPQE